MDNTLTEGMLAPLEMTQVPGRDLFVVAQYLLPTSAYLVQGCLVAAGIPAVVADANFAQMYNATSLATGGVRVLVPEQYLAQSRQVLAALARGDFALDEDADVGEPEA